MTCDCLATSTSEPATDATAEGTRLGAFITRQKLALDESTEEPGEDSRPASCSRQDHPKAQTGRSGPHPLSFGTLLQHLNTPAVKGFPHVQFKILLWRPGAAAPCHFTGCTPKLSGSPLTITPPEAAEGFRCFPLCLLFSKPTEAPFPQRGCPGSPRQHPQLLPTPLSSQVRSWVLPRPPVFLMLVTRFASRRRRRRCPLLEHQTRQFSRAKKGSGDVVQTTAARRAGGRSAVGQLGKAHRPEHHRTSPVGRDP